LDARPVPDLSDAIAQGIALPVRRVVRRQQLLRAALLLAGIAQLVIAIPSLHGDSLGMAMSAHAAHETAAWNLAVGAAFIAAAATPRRAAGLIPVLGTFLLVLGVLSVRDLASGAVTAGRLATHLAVLIGLVLLIALDRAERALPPGRFTAGRASSSGDGSGDSLRTVA
jgi:predicted anti-sigma-YlaC factor YlaD